MVRVLQYCLLCCAARAKILLIDSAIDRWTSTPMALGCWITRGMRGHHGTHSVSGARRLSSERWATVLHLSSNLMNVYMLQPNCMHNSHMNTH